MSVLFRYKTVGSLKVFTFVPKDLYIRGKRRDRRLLMSIVRIVRVPPFPFINRIFSFSFLFCVSQIQVNFPYLFIITGLVIFKHNSAFPRIVCVVIWTIQKIIKNG